jgi:Fe-S cluster assembly protein SufD
MTRGRDHDPPSHPREEDWRYSDVAAVASVWPVPAPERDRAWVPARACDAHALSSSDADESARHRASIMSSKSRRARGAISICSYSMRCGGFGPGRRSTCGLERGRIVRAGMRRSSAGAGRRWKSSPTVDPCRARRHERADDPRDAWAGKATGSCAGPDRGGERRAGHGTRAGQSVKAMLLDSHGDRQRQAGAGDLSPTMCKCAHGCAVGELDKHGAVLHGSRAGWTPPHGASAAAAARSSPRRVRWHRPTKPSGSGCEAAALAKLEGLAVSGDRGYSPPRHGEGDRGAQQRGGGGLALRYPREPPQPSCGRSPSPFRGGAVEGTSPACVTPEGQPWHYLDTAATGTEAAGGDRRDGAGAGRRTMRPSTAASMRARPR